MTQPLNQTPDVELRYFRDVDGREVDFVITEDLNPLYLIEIKWKDTAISKGLKYLKKRFPQAEAYQVSAQGGDSVPGQFLFRQLFKIKKCHVVLLADGV
jgi:hypothetical protein